jgi:DNA-binding transcriptional MocR family regulator
MAVRSVSAARLAALSAGATSTSPAYRGLSDAIRLLVADGRVPAGTRLPSERSLTAALGVSRTTVTRAYAELRDRGYLTSRQGSGSVAALPGSPTRATGAPLTPGDAAEGMIDLTCAAMSAPPGTSQAYEAAIEELPAYFDGTGYHPLGLPALREAIARRYCERGLPTTSDQVMITAGALGALALAGRTVLAPGDRVLMESPSYPNAIATMRAAGARLVALPMDPTGWDTESVVAALRQTAPRAAVLIPDFHNPTGALMGEAQREDVGAALTRTRTVPIIDETVAELPASAELRMPPPLAAFAPGAITVGSSSKVYWGGVRAGWIRAPREMMPALIETRLALDLGAPVLEQLVLRHLMGRHAEIVAHRQHHLATSRGALVAGLRDRLPQWSFTVPDGGLALWCELPEPLSTATTVAADSHGLLLAAGPRFAVESGLERFLRLPFTQAVPTLVDAVDRLGAAWDDAQSQRGGRSRQTPLVA